jgi:hypothetical protein
LSSGVTDVYGDVINNTTSAAVGITVSGNADVTFWGDVTNTSGLFRVSAGSSATFFGGMSGNGVSGGGDVYLESDITPGASPGIASFGGNVHFGVLTNLNLEIAGTTKGAEYDALDIAGTATLDCTLDVSLPGGFVPRDGDVFEILTAAGGISGTFATEIFPILSGNLFWNVVYSTNSVALQVAAPGLPGDYNQNGIVDAADYVLWRRGNGTIYTQSDYNLWRATFGQTVPGSGSGSSHVTQANVPEPATALLVAIGGAVVAIRRRRQRCGPAGGPR